MSYDVSIGDEWLNYTFNLSALFYDHMPADRSRGGLHELNGLTGKQACGVIGAALKVIHHTYCSLDGAAKFRAKYDAENGWGSTDGAILFLAQILAACAANPRKKLSVGA